MRHIRTQRTGIPPLLNKENENNDMNLPYLKNGHKKDNCQKNQYQINLNQRNKNIALKQSKKTYLNLCNKKKKNSRLDEAIKNQKAKMTVSTARVQSESSIVMDAYLSSRGDRNDIKKRKIWTQNINSGSIMARHKISEKMRAKMIDWLLQIHQAYHLKDETFYLAVFLMDEYFRRSQRILLLSQLHIIGVTALFMATKYQQIHPIRIKTVYKQIGHCKLPIKDIVNRQQEILECLNFCLKHECPFQHLEQVLYNLRNSIKKKIDDTHLEQIAKCYLQIAVFSLGIYAQEQPELLAKACILASIRTVDDPLSLAFYDEFSSVFGQHASDYNQLQDICSRIIFLTANFQNQYSDLENISKMIKKCIKSVTKKMIVSCAL